jgi:hypothetical protein
MRVIFIFLLALVTTTQAQQINPVPDYIFRNQMSVGRNAVTDTAAYMSIGPRYGAVKGFMPPIVTDTNAVTGVKRNGLLIFSIQLNNFAYWDSTTARFRKITAEASVDSLIFSTRAWRQKGDDSLGAIIALKTDTGLLSTKAYRQKGIDSVVTLISTLGGGTVLSVSAGTGMNFSTITTSGAVNADTLILSTRAWRQKAVDSLGGIAATKLSISDTATMLGAYLRKADTTAMLTPYLRKVDTTAMLGDYVRVAGYGLVKGTQTLSSDTAAMATRSRVQKGLDSVAALVAAPDSLVFSTRAWRQKGDDSLGVIIGTKATATGTTNYLSKFTGTSALGNSIVYATTSEVGISTPSPTHTLDVNGRTRIRTIDSTATGMNMLYSDADGVIKKAAIPAGGSGTVTSVATGFGLSGGTITTTGTLLVDSASIATRARVQKGIDSVSSLVAAKVNISDTATMLSPYAKSAALGLYLPLSGGTLTGGLTGTTGAFTSSGGDNTFNITHSSGSGIALNITKGGNGEGLYINKTSGTGNAATIVGTLNATTLVKSGGTSTQYLMADGTTSTLTNPVTGTGTTNYVPKWSSSSAQTISQIFDNGTNVGIGTNTPSSFSNFRTLSIVGNVFPSIYMRSNDSTNLGTFYIDAVGTRLESVSNHPLIFGTNGTQRMRISAAGDVGIGNTSPSYKLDVTGTLRNTTGAAFATSSGNVLVGTTVDGGSYKLDVQGALRNTTGAAFATTSGNVGVGTTDPDVGALGGKVFGVTGSFTRSRFNMRNLDGTSAGAITGTISFINGTRYLANIEGGTGSSSADDGYLAFSTKPNGVDGMSTRMYITNGGNVGVGTTSPTERLDVDGRARIRTIDSTATAMNMLYADATGVIKKAAVPSGGITGTGISGYFPKWTGTSTQDTSQLFQLGRNIGIGTASPTFRLHLPDAGNTANQAMLAGTVFGSDGNGQTIKPSNSTALTIYGQSDIGYIYGAAFSSTGRWGINTVNTADATLSVNGDVKIVTIDSTSTARNMLYADANGIIKKSAALSMSDDVMTVAGSWVVTKDAGSGFSINNVAYTTNGTTKMVTIDGAFYIAAELFSDGSWDDVATIPSGFRPQKTVNWTNNFIVSGAEYEQSGGTDFTGALQWTYAQMRVTDEGKVQINGSINTNTIDAGGADYVVIQFTQTYIIK